MCVVITNYPRSRDRTVVTWFYVQLCEIGLKFRTSMCHFGFRLLFSSHLSDQLPLVSFRCSFIAFLPFPFEVLQIQAAYLSALLSWWSMIFWPCTDSRTMHFYYCNAWTLQHLLFLHILFCCLMFPFRPWSIRLSFQFTSTPCSAQDIILCTNIY